ncbi:tetratricopeptide repeat protein [Pelomicrobium sp. G1]|uniref:tetratricopeptide repeat protein n=1 Tax=unclassified Pelomicrobium TaxID=2815318 RepID=UPI003F76D9D1
MPVLSGITGGPGRPVSLASFALQYADWPRNVVAFKYVNVLLHLLNGCLLFWLWLKLGRLAGISERRNLLIGLIAASIWLLHPLLVSTTLYVVQRMTQLSALFTLAGLLLYLYGRECHRAGAWRSGYLWTSLGIGLFGLLATLSKENGILICALALALEGTLLRNLPSPPGWRAWKFIFLYGPLVLLALVVAWRFDTMVLGPYAIRDFTLVERLMTQARVLVEYLGLVVAPVPSALGLYHDDYAASRGLFAPATTFWSGLLIVSLLVLAFAARGRAPVLAFGLLWFFIGHLLESTIFPLELYFEHRNYLPMAGLVFALSFYGVALTEKIKSASVKRVLRLFPVLYLSILAAVSFNEIRLWGDPIRQAYTWAREKPDSRRAQERLASVWQALSEYERAAAVYRGIAEIHPLDVGAYLGWLSLGCFNDMVSLPDRDTLFARLEKASFSNAPIASLDVIVTEKEKRGCARVNDEYVFEIINGLEANPAYKPHLTNLGFLAGRLHATNGNLDKAIKSLDAAYAAQPRVDIAYIQAGWLASAGLRDEALHYLKQARQATSPLPLKRSLQLANIAALERAILRDKGAP